MNSFDSFCNDLLEQSKRFNEKRKSEKSEEGKRAYQHASLLLAICSLEAYVNGISEEITLAVDFPIHEKGILLEREVKLEKGQWILKDGLKMTRLIERIELLYFRHSNHNTIDSHAWWPTLKHGIEYRNKITHPKDPVIIPENFNDSVIDSVIKCLSVLYSAIYKRPFPKTNLQLNSNLDF